MRFSVHNTGTKFLIYFRSANAKPVKDVRFQIPQDCDLCENVSNLVVKELESWVNDIKNVGIHEIKYINDKLSFIYLISCIHYVRIFINYITFIFR